MSFVQDGIECWVRKIRRVEEEEAIQMVRTRLADFIEHAIEEVEELTMGDWVAYARFETFEEIKELGFVETARKYLKEALRNGQAIDPGSIKAGFQEAIDSVLDEQREGLRLMKDPDHTECGDICPCWLDCLEPGESREWWIAYAEEELTRIEQLRDQLEAQDFPTFHFTRDLVGRVQLHEEGTCQERSTDTSPTGSTPLSTETPPETG